MTRNAAIRPADGPDRPKSRPRGRGYLLALALAGVAACAQPAADPVAASRQEQPAMTAPTSVPPDATAPTDNPADAAAAAADRAAAYAESVTPPPKANPAPSTPLPLPQGPALSTQELRARVLKLIAGLKTARDTEAAHVAQVLGTPLGPDPKDAERQRVAGPLVDGVRYGVRVNALYSGTPGQHVEIRWVPAGWKGDPRKPENALSTCSFDFGPFSDEIAAMGYARSKSAPHLKEFWSFRKDVPANNITFYLVVTLYRALDGSDPKGRPCVMSVEIDADDAEVDHG